MKIITVNKKAFHTYEIKEKFEAGIVLNGDEVKSLRQGNVSLADSFATIHNGQIQLLNCYIAPYSHSYSKSGDPSVSRRLLMHKREIHKLIGEISRKGLTIVPLKMYFGNRGYVKVELGLAKHKNAASKKREMREKDIKRETDRELKYRA